MDEIIAPLRSGGGYVCAGRRGPYDEPGASGYAFFGKPGAGEVRDLGNLIRLDSEKCGLFACDALVVITTPAGAGQTIQIVEPEPARVQTRLSAKLASHGFLLGVDRTAACGLFSDGRKATVRRLDKSLAPLAPSAGSVSPEAACVAAAGHGWLAANHALDPRRERRTLIVLDREGKPAGEHKLPGTLNQVVVTANGLRAACALIGGEVALVDLASGGMRRFKPHLEATKKDWLRVVVDPEGGYFLSWIATGGSVNRTDLATGETTPVLELTWLAREETVASRGWLGVKKQTTRREIYVPDFAVHGGRLLTLSGRRVRDKGDPRTLFTGTPFLSEQRARGP